MKKNFLFAAMGFFALLSISPCDAFSAYVKSDTGNTVGQSLNLPYPIKLIDTILYLKGSAPRPKKPGNALSAKKTNNAEAPVKIRFSIGIDGYNTYLVADLQKKNIKPSIQKYPDSLITDSKINFFLDSTIGALSIDEDDEMSDLISDFSTNVFKNMPSNRKAVVWSQANFLTSVFPAGAVPGGTFVVTKFWSNLTAGGTMYLPKNFTVVVDSDVDTIFWHFANLIFEDGATIDLSRRYTKVKPPRGKDGGSRCNSCNCTVDIQDGFPGDPGIHGTNGKNAASLTMQVDQLSTSGNLWIRADGDDGGDGGDGANGGNGGSGNRDGDHYHRPGQGGNGGLGGPGGDAGAVARISFKKAGFPQEILRPKITCDCSPKSLPSVRPAELGGTDFGLVVASGINGCPGKGGMSGVKGNSGNDCDTGGPNLNGGPLVSQQAPNGNLSRIKCQ